VLLGLIVRPKTGEILAMGVYPNFDPNNPGESPDDYRRNRLIEDVHEPGSTFKVVVVAGAVNEKRARLTDVINCENGRFVYCGRVLRDHGNGHQSLTVEEILEMSSNIGAAKVGMLLGEPLLYDYIRRFGLGNAPEFSIPGEFLNCSPCKENGIKPLYYLFQWGMKLLLHRLQVVMAISAIATMVY
jgi:cell division protein FtsI (penicillin-binding protein 3)